MFELKWWTNKAPSIVFEAVWECKLGDIYINLSVELWLILTAGYVAYSFFSPYKVVDTIILNISAQILSKLSRLSKLGAKLLMAFLDFNKTSRNITLRFRPNQPYVSEYSCTLP